MAELTDEQILDRAQHAKRILDDELYQEGVLMVEERIIAEWRATQPAEYEKREACYAELRALGNVVGLIRNFMEHGDFLKDQLEKKERHEQ